MENTNNQYALITGGTSGIGRELAKLFAQDGYNLVLVARNEDELAATAKEITERFGVTVTTISKDLMQPNAGQELYSEIKAKGITIDVLVNDAGQGQRGGFTDYDLQRDIDIIHLNIITVTTLTKLFLKDMLARNEGRILQLSSTASQTPGPLLAVYSATKAYVHSFTQSIINEIKNTNVVMTALLPGATDTNFFTKAGASNTKQAMEMKLDDPADVAKDGYDALMRGETKVISGFRNKVQATVGSVVSEQAAADNFRKTMEESDVAEERKKVGGQ